VEVAHAQFARKAAEDRLSDGKLDAARGEAMRAAALLAAAQEKLSLIPDIIAVDEKLRMVLPRSSAALADKDTLEGRCKLTLVPGL
jgi:hypothetical protein